MRDGEHVDALEHKVFWPGAAEIAERVQQLLQIILSDTLINKPKTTHSHVRPADKRVRYPRVERTDAHELDCPKIRLVPSRQNCL